VEGSRPAKAITPPCGPEHWPVAPRQLLRHYNGAVPLSVRLRPTVQINAQPVLTPPPRSQGIRCRAALDLDHS
jgi:hypothetical protein